MPEKKGHQICAGVAGDIKDAVETVLEEHDKVPPSLVKILREMAREDARIHIRHDPSFSYGGGPAVGEKSSN